MVNNVPVKAAVGRLVRNPRTLKPLPTIGDAAAPVTVDRDDPLWYRRLRDGDIVVVGSTGTTAAVSGTTSASSATTTAPAAPAPASAKE